MQYYTYYQTPDPFDDLIMESDGQYLTALSFTSDQTIENQTNELNKNMPLPFKKKSMKFSKAFLMVRQ